MVNQKVSIFVDCRPGSGGMEFWRSRGSSPGKFYKFDYTEEILNHCVKYTFYFMVSY